jgi:hypothetical protein
VEFRVHRTIFLCILAVHYQYHSTNAPYSHSCIYHQQCIKTAADNTFVSSLKQLLYCKLWHVCWLAADTPSYSLTISRLEDTSSFVFLSAWCSQTSSLLFDICLLLLFKQDYVGSNKTTEQFPS